MRPWRRHRWDAARYEAVFESWSTDYGFGFDFTPYFELNVCACTCASWGLAASITYLEQLNEQIGAHLRIPYQRAAEVYFGGAVPRAGSFAHRARISVHSRIAYGTARADSWESSNARYLVREQRGAPSPSALIPTYRRRSSSWGRRSRLGGSKPGCDAPCSILRGN